jgi:hypothetical protein
MSKIFASKGISKSVYIETTYDPKPDITVYELALLLPYMIRVPIDQAAWDKLGTATRHLKRV